MFILAKLVWLYFAQYIRYSKRAPDQGLRATAQEIRRTIFPVIFPSLLNCSATAALESGISSCLRTEIVREITREASPPRPSGDEDGEARLATLMALDLLRGHDRIVGVAAVEFPAQAAHRGHDGIAPAELASRRLLDETDRLDPENPRKRHVGRIPASGK